MKFFCVDVGTPAMVFKESDPEKRHQYVVSRKNTFNDGDLVIDPVRWYNSGRLEKTMFDRLARDGFSVFRKNGWILVVAAEAVETIC